MNLLFTHFDYFIECIFAREAIPVVQIFLHQIVPTMKIYGAIDDHTMLSQSTTSTSNLQLYSMYILQN